MSWIDQYTTRYTFKDFLKSLLKFLVIIVAFIIVFALIAILDVFDLWKKIIPLAFFVAIIYFGIVLPEKRKKKEATIALDNRIIAFAQALYIWGYESNIRFGYTIYELTDWIKDFLAYAHEEPKKSGRCYKFTYEDAAGEVWTFRYEKYDHLSFAAGCLLHCAYSKYLKTVDIAKWLEESILPAISKHEDHLTNHNLF